MVAETLADALLCAANAALVLDINLGGLALGIQKVESEWEVNDADTVAASASARCNITCHTVSTCVRSHSTAASLAWRALQASICATGAMANGSGCTRNW